MIPPFADLLYEVDGHVCTLTLNRPQRRNALSANLVNELIVGLETAAADPDIGAIILTGAGKAFCSGGDQRIRGKDGYKYEGPGGGPVDRARLGRLHILEQPDAAHHLLAGD